MAITEIKIKNIKRFSDYSDTVVFKPSIQRNMLNLLVAPNGWGKSSITTAFDSLQEYKLDVSKVNKNKQLDYLDSELSIKLNNHTYIANGSINNITPVLTTKVIHCDIFPKSVTNDEGYYSSSTRRCIGIKDIPITKSVIEPEINYWVTHVKSSFGKNSKVLSDHNLKKTFLKQADTILKINANIIESINRLKKQRKMFLPLIDKINSFPTKKTVYEIKNSIERSDFFQIYQNTDYLLLKNTFYPNESDIDCFLNLYQIIFFINDNELLNLRSYYEFQKNIDDVIENTKYVNSTWKKFEKKENKGITYIHFPDADVISNGERDIMTMCVHLQLVKNGLVTGKPFLLILDEVFDYLDDANMLAAQYYLSDFLKYAEMHNSEVYLCIFTHLNPENFRCNLLEKRINPIYLGNKNIVTDTDLKKLISYREELYEKNRKNELTEESEKSIYENLSKYFFHFCPTELDFSTDIKNLIFPYKPVIPEWMSGVKFLKKILKELNNYLEKDTPDFDPYSVAIAIRLGCEKNVYNQLGNEEKNVFLGLHGTINKMKYAENKGLFIPDAYYILSIIHGETDHISYDEDDMRFNEAKSINAFNNKVIKHMVEELFEYKSGFPVTIDKLH